MFPYLPYPDNIKSILVKLIQKYILSSEAANSFEGQQCLVKL